MRALDDIERALDDIEAECLAASTSNSTAASLDPRRVERIAARVAALRSPPTPPARGVSKHRAFDFSKHAARKIALGKFRAGTARVLAVTEANS